MAFGLAAIIAVVCWRQVGNSTGIVGIGEGVRATVSTPFPAQLQTLLVQPYQMVRAGDPVAVIAPNDPRVDLDLLQADLSLARLQLQPTVAEENAIRFEQIHMTLLRTRAELAVARVNLARAETQVRRDGSLFREKLVSEDVYEETLKTRDVYAAEVHEKSNIVVQTQSRLSELEPLGLPKSIGTNSNLDRLRALQAAAVSNWAPVTLVAPADGMVTTISRLAGENVVAGEPIVSIHSLRSDRVVGYLRQPYPIQPQVGMEVSMVTRERQPRRFSGVVTEVGAQVEVITNSLAFVRPGMLVDAGLPIAISLPPDMPLRPGEIVDLAFRKRPATPTALATNTR